METHAAEYDAAGKDGGLKWVGWSGPVSPGEADTARRTLANIENTKTETADKKRQAEKLNALYTGWSRFFVVTSSAGHVHRSMECTTCRPSTRYGWLPELSGKTEAEAVTALGPNLCTVCFPSAPVEHQGGKISKRQAEKLADTAAS